MAPCAVCRRKGGLWVKDDQRIDPHTVCCRVGGLKLRPTSLIAGVCRRAGGLKVAIRTHDYAADRVPPNRWLEGNQHRDTPTFLRMPPCRWIEVQAGHIAGMMVMCRREDGFKDEHVVVVQVEDVCCRAGGLKGKLE